jgi:EAL domain-containing protein (putative c-di-GMP-specific phosphodiesterase class I)
LRWHHPTKGLISPLAFIPVAEESGQIFALGEWVLREAARLLKQSDDLGRPLRLAVNVSPRQFRHTSFVAEVSQILRDAGADPTHLVLEVTEGLVIEDIHDTIAKMEELNKIGIHFSIDDFGTGYSSLAYLKRMPLHELKSITRSCRTCRTIPTMSRWWKPSCRSPDT